MSLFGNYTGYIIASWGISISVLATLTYSVFRRNRNTTKRLQYYCEKKYPKNKEEKQKNGEK